MKDQYDFSTSERGAVASSKGKTRITIMLDDAVIEAARSLAESEGYGYQTVINNTLRQTLLSHKVSVVGVGKIKKGITASELKTLEEKLLEVASEIHRMMEPEI